MRSARPHWVMLPWLLVAVGCAVPDHPRTNAAVKLGYRKMVAPQFEPLDDQLALGLEFDHRPEGWPVAITVGLGGGVADKEIDEGRSCFIFCSQQSTRISSTSIDPYLGLKYYLPAAPGDPRVYVGGGVALTYADSDVYVSRGTKSGDHDSSVGGWLQFGVQVPVNIESNMSIGLETRGYLGLGTNLFGQSSDNDFFEVTLSFVRGW